MSASLNRAHLDHEANRLFAEDFKRMARAAESMGFPALPKRPAPVMHPIVRAVAEPRRDILHIATPDGGEWRLSALADIAAAAAGVGRVELRSDRRDQKGTRARQVFCWLARRFTKHSYPKIGQEVGNRDHTTIMHAVRRVQEVVDDMPTKPIDDPRAWAKAIVAAPWLPAKVRDPRWRKGE